MIHIDNDKIDFAGTIPDLLTELTLIMKRFVDEEVVRKPEILHEAVDMAFMPIEEVKKKAADELARSLLYTFGINAPEGRAVTTMKVIDKLIHDIKERRDDNE